MLPAAVPTAATTDAGDAVASERRALAIGKALELARPQCVWVLSRFRIPREDAEDLLHDAFVLLLRKRDEVECPERWLPRTLAHLCLHYWRTRRRRPTEPFAPDAEPVAAETSPELRALARHDLERALATLPLRPRRLLLLRHVEGCSAAEVAGRLGYSPASIDRVGRRGLAALARALTPPADRRRSPARPATKTEGGST